MGACCHWKVRSPTTPSRDAWPENGHVTRGGGTVVQLGVPIGETATRPRPPKIDQIRARPSQSGPVWTVKNGHVHWDCIPSDRLRRFASFMRLPVASESWIGTTRRSVARSGNQHEAGLNHQHPRLESSASFCFLALQKGGFGKGGGGEEDEPRQAPPPAAPVDATSDSLIRRAHIADCARRWTTHTRPTAIFRRQVDTIAGVCLGFLSDPWRSCFVARLQRFTAEPPTRPARAPSNHLGCFQHWVTVWLSGHCSVYRAFRTYLDKVSFHSGGPE